jgi:thioester reductase-like protein
MATTRARAQARAAARVTEKADKTTGTVKADKAARAARPGRPVLVTGFPNFTAKRLTEKLLTEGERVFLLAQEKFAEAASSFLAAAGAGPGAAHVAEVLVGDVVRMDLGLSGAEYKAVAAELRMVHHVAGIYYLGAERERVRFVNVEGTRNTLDLAADATHLERFVFWSTAQVSRTRQGVVMEDELEAGQRFRNAYEESKYEAERLVQRSIGRLPVTVLRPGIIVGDSSSGEIDKMDGPYYLMLLIVNSPDNVPLPLPGKGSAPLYLVPIDYVVAAADVIARDPRSAGRTFHLTDPAPLSARRISEILAACAEKKEPRGSIPLGIAKALLKAPGLARLAQTPLALVEAFNHLVFYNCRNTLEILDGTGVSCPPFESYAETLIRFVQQRSRERRAETENEAVDPLD